MNDLNYYETDTKKGIRYIKEALKSNATVPLTVTGSSMMPLLKPQRDIVWLEKCDVGQIKKGDILLFERENGKPVLHRVIKIRNDVLIMNGDALSWAEQIEKTQVIACVKNFERNKKMFTCDSKRVKLWNALWSVTRPVRTVIRKVRSLLTAKKR